MADQSLFKVICQTDVALIRVGEALQEIYVFHLLGKFAALLRPPPLPLRRTMAGSLC